MMTAEMAVMKWAASSPAPTPSSGVPVVAVSRTTGPVTVTTTVETSVMRTRPAEVDQHVRISALPFKKSDKTNLCPLLPLMSYIKIKVVRRQCIYYTKS